MAAVVCWKQKAVRQCRRWLRCERLSAFHACSTLERRSACGHMSVLVVFSCCVCVCVSEAGLDTDKKKKKNGKCCSQLRLSRAHKMTTV